ncbi:SDR family oxidoreductase [Mycobacterium sp. SMC-4]|uniref:SDR family oxidoreductase n=1 Tax=Mycobacterium sp. SMC-4 TaxID=2857059 RepID=UPI003D0823DA
MVNEQGLRAPEVAVVTGGAGGMGLATARVLGRRTAVLISDVNEQRLETARLSLVESGVDCRAAICDITDAESVRGLVRTATEWGNVRSIIHTAGLSPSMGSPESIVRVNAVGTQMITQAFLAVATEGMVLVNVASVAGHQLPRVLMPVGRYKRGRHDAHRLRGGLLAVCDLVPAARRSQIAYVLSKNFVIWYSKAMAAQFGAKGARVLSISPGSFDTEMGQLEDGTGAGALAQLSALRRFGRPDEIAELLAFCAGPEAGYLTGTDIVCDGGAMAAWSLSTMRKLARG